jgi:hypothetical protein
MWGLGNPDPGKQKLAPKKESKKKFYVSKSCGLEASPGAWMSFVVGLKRQRYMTVFLQQNFKIVFFKQFYHKKPCSGSGSGFSGFRTETLDSIHEFQTLLDIIYKNEDFF